MIRSSSCLFASAALLLFGCVGDSPITVPSTPVDGGGGTENDSGALSDGAVIINDAGASSDGAAPNQDGGAPACSRVQVTTLTGTGAAGLQEGAGAVAKFDDPQGIVAGPDGTLFVADNHNKRIRKVLSDGTTSTYATSGTNLLSAYRLVYRAGDLWVIDRTNDALVRVSPGTPPMVATSYQIGALAAVGSNLTGTAMYVTQTQNCYISKMNGAFTMSARFTGGAGVSDCGNADGNATNARFSNSILDVAFDGTTMLVADTGNFRIRKVSETDGSVTTLAGSTQGHTDGTGAAAQFDEPTGLAVDPQSHIVYVADKNAIRAVTQAGVVTTLVGTTAGFDDGTGCNAKFGELRALTYYAGSLYATDVNRVRRIKLP